MKLSLKKKIIIGISVIILITSVVGFKKYQYTTGFGMSVESKKNRLEHLIKNEDYYEARELTYTYFITDPNNRDDMITIVDICADNRFTSFSQAEEYKQKCEDEKRKQDELKKKEEEAKVDNEYTKIVDEVNSINISNMTKEQLTKYVNEYMDFLNKYNNKNYDLTVKNLSNLKFKYAYSHADRYFDLYKNMERYELKIGMTKDEVIAFTDYVYPEHINKTTTSSGTHEQYVFGGIYLYFDNGTLTSFQN
ncbi:hypothetical protein [Inconstantimicrobium mannanitabidum]|uniref:Uncharacterized protein n=1 Tax=Inconstantimicrobium mannanitabidum TaxID=1604901 RepID=A0ACB5R9U1_9CLOT|nr:hypothetical protein [Clostridium sp. TW13]GKX65807.1 hypothetical protein rsdtw13_10650 [Clostridium sp. TW13]